MTFLSPPRRLWFQFSQSVCQQDYGKNETLWKLEPRKNPLPFWSGWGSQGGYTHFISL